jgi:uroporphyrinogen decarboxylase
MPSIKKFEPLPKAEVIKAVERKKPSRIPLIHCHWWGEGLEDQYGKPALEEFEQRYPSDALDVWASPIIPEEMNLSWKFSSEGGHDSRVVLDDWAKLDEFIDKLVPPEKYPHWEEVYASRKKSIILDRYCLFSMWNLFFERPWMLRGMENLMLDYYMEPGQVHKLHDALCDQYIRYLEFAKREFSPDGYWTSDDLGHQTQSMMPPEVFRDLILPYYKKIGKTCQRLGLHWWLHSCGNNTPLMPMLIEAGVDVFHPVQKHTMDEKLTVQDFGGKITFLAGIDVQHTLQEKNQDGVREEVRFLIDTFDLPNGGMCIASGNGIVRGTPLANIEAFLDEAYVYGEKHRAKFMR